MILSRPIPMYAGKQRPNVNAGTMSNKGFEFSVNYFNSAFSDFKYNIGLNLTFIRNEITSLAGGDPIRSGGVGRSGSTTKTEVGREISYSMDIKLQVFSKLLISLLIINSTIFRFSLRPNLAMSSFRT
ncbi:MAG: hypothetical protein HC905_02270 [Bacteroidales bacterium]|nr:hypothetical protein [Bacteroidales bacterium]